MDVWTATHIHLSMYRLVGRKISTDINLAKQLQHYQLDTCTPRDLFLLGFPNQKIFPTVSHNISI